MRDIQRFSGELPSVEFLHELADAADRETMSRFRKPLDIDTKPKQGTSFDPVTEADREAERAIRALIESRFPDHSVMGEEFGTSGDGPLQWVLDPIDGTRPFICGIPVWGTLIGLKVDGYAHMGLMSQPVTRERFWADGANSWLKRDGCVVQLRTSSKDDLQSAILHTTSPELISQHPQFDFKALNDSVRMTRYGGECYAFAMLAAGQIDIIVEFSIQPYDVIAMIPIIEQAGGVMTTVSGGRPEGGGSVVASANPRLHEAALEILTNAP